MSCFDMVKFEKGQIWKICFKDKTEVKGREQDKDRPWIILSTRKFNQSSGMITAAPLTTRDSIVSPAQVMFTDMRGKNSVVLCEQIRTFDYKSGFYEISYMGCVSDEVLEMVDNAISIHLGLKFAPSTLNRLYESIESIMRTLENTKKRIDEPRITDEDVIKLAEKLSSIVEPSKPTSGITLDNKPITVLYNEKSEPSLPTTPDTTEEASSAVETSTEEIKPVNDVSSCNNRKQRKWTKEMCENFLHDVDVLPMKEVMTKWDITKKTQVYYMKHYAKTMLEK